MRAIQISLENTLKILNPMIQSPNPLTYQSPWIIPGTDGRDAYNPFTGNLYQGFNQVKLGYQRFLLEQPINAWATFQQIKAHGGFVKKGSKAQRIRFYATKYKDSSGKHYSNAQIQQMPVAEYNKRGIYSYKCLKTYSVFNLSQTSGLPEPYYQFIEPLLNPIESIQGLDDFIASLQLNIRHRLSSLAYYEAKLDRITMPEKTQFRSTLGYYATLLHEAGHALGASHRLNRDLSGTFGDEVYAQEELAAELFAATLLDYYGFGESLDNSAAYLRSWLSVLCTEDRNLETAKQAVKAMLTYCGLN